jgi:hypothetical protein
LWFCQHPEKVNGAIPKTVKKGSFFLMMRKTFLISYKIEFGNNNGQKGVLFCKRRF